MRRFGVLAAVTAGVVYLQVVLGSVVRITGSGLGCPDWPLCHGSLIPAMDYHTLIEYGHRLVGLTGALLILATAISATLLFRREPAKHPRGLAVAAGLALGLYVFQGVLGGITVLMKNSPFTVALHLGNALLVLGASLLVALWARQVLPAPAPLSSRGRRLLFWAPVGALVIVVSGAYVVGSGASYACTGWPLCGNAPGGLADTHMLHRVIVLAGSIAIVGAAWVGARHWRGTGMAATGWLTLVGLLAEIAVGATQVLLALPAGLRALHLALATAVWAGVVLMAAAAWLESRREPTTEPVRRPAAQGARA